MTNNRSTCVTPITNDRSYNPLMRRRSVFFCVFAIGLSSGAPAQDGEPKGNRDANAWVGTWLPVGKSEFKRIHISNGPSGLHVIVVARTTFSEYAWAKTALIPFGRNVEDKTVARSMAIWNVDFGKEYAVFALNGNRLDVEIYTQFTDTSKRSNYYLVEKFVQATAKRP